MKEVITAVFLVFSSVVSATTFYVAPNGNNSSPGTIDKPWATWDKAFTSVSAGDKVFFRGGVYQMTITNGSGYTVTCDGTITDTIYYYNYPGETPILDCRNVIPSGLTNFAIVNGVNAVNYVKFKGLTIRNLRQVYAGVECIGWRLNGLNTIVENCTMYNIEGMAFESYYGRNLHFINCDAYNCCDRISVTGVLPGNRGTGFACLNANEIDGSTYFSNCRAWKCSDDGFMAYDISYVEYDNCWSFNNGALEGGGSGFKLGFTAGYPTISLRRTVKNCLAAFNRIDGIFTNEGGQYIAQSMHVYNNTCYHNGYYPGWTEFGFGLWIDNTSSTNAEEFARIFKNNLSYMNATEQVKVTANAVYSHEYNSWDTPPGVTITNADFKSVDSTGITGARQANGSLPNLNFLKLAAGSNLIDAGTYVGFSYSGSAPDLGYSEYGSGSAQAVLKNVDSAISVKLYPNPVHSLLNVRIEEKNLKTDFIRVINLSGTVVIIYKVNPDVYEFQIPINLKKGAYIVQLGSGELTLFSQKLIVTE